MFHDQEDARFSIPTNPNDYPQGDHRTPPQQVHNGVTRVTSNSAATQRALDEAAAAAAAAQAPELNRVHGGTLRATAGASEVESAGVTQHTTYVTSYAGRSVHQTIQRSGSQMSIETVPGEPGSRTSLDAAVRSGAVVHNRATGQYELPGQQAPTAEELRRQESDELARLNQQATQQQESTDDAPTGHVLGAENAAALLADAQEHGIDQGSFDRLQARAIEAAVTGSTDHSAMAKALAVETGMDPAMAVQFVEHGPALYQAAADAEMAKLGLTHDSGLHEAYAYMRSKPTALRHVLQKFAMESDVRPMKALAMEFIAKRSARK